MTVPADDLTTGDPLVTFSGSATDVGAGVKRVVLELETPAGRVSYEPPATSASSVAKPAAS